MIDLEDDPALDDRLRRAFSTIANATVINDVLQDGSARVRRTWPQRTLSAAAALLLVATAMGLWQLNSRSTRPKATSALPRPPLVVPPPLIVPPTPVLPQGSEYPIERVPAFPLGSTADGGPVIDGSTIEYSQTADARQYRYRTLDVQGDYVVERSCVGTIVPDTSAPSETITSGGCGNTLESSLRPFTGSFWQEEDGKVGSGYWRWYNLPADTEFVQYRSGDLTLWQRPIDRLVLFPSGSAESAEAVAYRSDGAVLAMVDDATLASAAESAAEFFADLHREPQLDSADVELARAGVQSRFAACLEGRDVALTTSGGFQRVALPHNGDDMEPVWQACLVDAQGWLDDFIADHS